MLNELEGIRILLTDDNEYNRMVVRETLELKIKNVRIDEAYDGLMALNMLQQKEYDVVIMDLVMPQLNGLETTQKIRSEFSDGKKNIPIIAITASVIKSERAKCHAAGMNGFIPKPFKTHEVISAIYSVLKGIEQFDTPDVVMSGHTTHRLINLDYVNEISEGDTERIRRYGELFIQKISGMMEGLREAAKSHDFEKVRIEAHSMKSILKFNGVLSGVELAETIEKNCSSKTDLDILPELIEQLNSICNGALEEIKSVIQAGL